MSLLTAVHGRGLLSARPAAAAANEGYIYSASDASLYRSNGSSWDTIGGTGLADQGTFTYLDGTVAAAPATPAAGKLRLYAKTGKVLAVKDDAGAETVLGAGGGSDVVQVASGAGSVRVPGIAVADRVPASPNGADHEFDVALTDGFAIGSPDIINTTDIRSHLHMQKSAAAAFTLHGRGWTLAALGLSVPFTVTSKLSDLLVGASFRAAYMGIGEASPGKIMTRGNGSAVGLGTASFNLGQGNWTSPTVRGTWGGDDVRSMSLPTYWRYIVTSSTNVEVLFSANGLVWTSLVSGVNPGFTVGSVVLVITSNDNSQTIEAAWDWLRFS